MIPFVEPARALTFYCASDTVSKITSGGTFTVSVDACAIFDGSTGDWGSTNHSVSSSSNSSLLVPQSTVYNYMGCLIPNYGYCVPNHKTDGQVIYEKNLKAGVGVFLTSSGTTLSFGPFKAGHQPNAAATYIQVTYLDKSSGSTYTIYDNVCDATVNCAI